MAQRFIVHDGIGYRDPFDAVKAGATQSSPVAEFDVTARINDFYQVTEFDGAQGAVGTTYVRTIDELDAFAEKGAVIQLKKIFVKPYLEQAPRGSRKAAREAAKVAAAA